MSRIAWLLAGGLGTAGCAPAIAPREAPQPAAPIVASADSVREEIVLELPPSAPDNGEADEAALWALRELEFKSLTKGAGHVRGVVPAPSPGFFRAAAAADDMLAASSRGGPASTSAPTYDINVESFAENFRVRYYIDYFLGPTRERFTIWLGRMARYEGMIRQRFRALGVPEDLVYLGLIESGYSNTAVSRANAVGMWQFIRSTARLYGLTVDTWVDERRDPFRATDAAARYLSDLNRVFGSWYLAAAAYNAGEGRISRGIRRLSAQPDSLTDETFFDLADRRYLRVETRDYVPKLIAAALIAKDPARYGFDSVPALAPLVFDEITVPDATGLDVIARLADTSARAITELNPHYVRDVTPPGRSAVVRVPRGMGATVAGRYADLLPSERVNFLEHVVRAGETLGEIGRRYRVGVSLLRAANGNVHPRRLRIGQRLVIPVSAAARSRATAGDVPPPSRGVPGVRYHTVRRGETLWKLSQRYGVRLSELRRWNGLSEDAVLRVGQRLRVAP